MKKILFSGAEEAPYSALFSNLLVAPSSIFQSRNLITVVFGAMLDL